MSFLTVRLRNEFRTRLIERYSADGLNPTHGAILICLQDVAPLTQKGLSELLRMDPSDTVRLLDDLERSGFLQRTADPADRRRNLLVLTGSGSTQVERCKTIIRTVEEDLLGLLSASDRRQLQALLKRVIGAVDARIPADQVPAGGAR